MYKRPTAINDGDFSGYDGLFLEPSPAPTQEVIEALGAFFHEKKEVPRSEGSSDTLDYDIDADYIYAAFMQGYGIDLMEEGLHWHKFLALWAALPDDTAMSKIIGDRQYDGKDKDMCKKKPVSYTHLDVYKRQYNIGGIQYWEKGAGGEGNK